MSPFFQSRRLHLVILLLTFTALFSLFQNMSPFDQDDIRRLAPKEPEPLQKGVDYLPKNPRGTSPQALGEEILKHNLAGPLREMEERFEDWTTLEAKTEGGAESGVDVVGRAPSAQRSYKMKAGLMGKSALGVKFERHFKLKCEYSPLQQNFQLRYDQPLSSRAQLTMQHNSNAQQSSIAFSYQW